METTEHLSELVTIVINETKTSRDAINNTVGQIHEAMVHVKHAISDIEGVATDMAASTEEQSASTMEMQDTCEKVMGLARDVKADGEKTAGAGQKMSELSADLLGEVSKFRL